MRIQVTSYNGVPPAQLISAEFSEQGGSIGRADNNTLELPDLEKHISRLHASIISRGGNFVIQSHGTVTPVYVNGHPLGSGQEAAIVNGDEIGIGGYLMRAMHSDMPATDLEQTCIPPHAPVAGVPSKDDPLAMFGGGSGTPNPFADLLAPAARLAPNVIPPDFDPFANPTPAQPPVQAQSAASAATEYDLGPSTAAASIDELFGLGPSAGTGPFEPGNPLAEPLNQPDAARSVDPLVALGAAPAPKSYAGRPQRNDAQELNSAFQPPKAQPDDTVRMPRTPLRPDKAPSQLAQARSAAPAPESPGIVLSWEGSESGPGGTEIKSIVVPSPKPERRKEASAELPPEKPPAPQSAASEAAPAVVPRAAAAANLDALLQAFLTGAGVPNLTLPGELTPEMMNTFGQLLREATQGTLDLLLARALTKQEVRADVTMIVAKENNPLKFSPSAEVALSHLLAPQGYGFMMPLRAMKDAYNDLRSHQFGFMAGMRAALAGVLKRFDPQQLEGRLMQKKVIDSLLPMHRKAKLWDLFAELYGDISKEAEDDFHELFGKAFLRAYEEQIDKLRQDDKNTIP